MLSNYFRTALRNLLKYKFYMFINILGLAIGLTCFLFILVYVNDELSFDEFHEKGDQIYRVNFLGRIFDQEMDLPQTGDPYGPFMMDNFPEVINQVRLQNRGGYLVKYGDRSYKEEDVIIADSTFFEVFTFPLLEGDPKTVLTKPNTMVITPEIAKKYFGEENPVGKTLKISNRDDFLVTGVMKPMPANSHLDYNIILSMSYDRRQPAESMVKYQLLYLPGPC